MPGSSIVNATSLKRRVLRAGVWTVFGFASSQVIRLGGNLVVTRMLVPDMFGVMAIAQVVMMGFALFSDFGLNQSVIQSRRGTESAYLNTVWVAQIFRGIVIGALALAFSLTLFNSVFIQRLVDGSVYANRQLPYVISVLSFTAIISGLESSKLVIANRNLALVKIIKIEIFCQVLGLCCMIFWAMISPSIWVLVSGSLISAMMKTILSHAILPGHRNRFEWDKQAFHEILAFGKWTTLSSILWFLVSSGDRLLLGGMVSAEILGFYATAFALASAFQQVIGKMVANVAFPALSEVMRERPHRLCAAYYRVRLPFDLVSLFLSGFLFVTGSLIIQILYDKRYAGSGHMLEVLALSLIMTRYFVTDQCFVAMGNPKLLALLNLSRVITLYLLVPAGYFLYGFEGALWAIVLSAFGGAPLMFYFKIKLDIVDWMKETIVLPMFLVGIGCGEIVIQIIRFFYNNLMR